VCIRECMYLYLYMNTYIHRCVYIAALEPLARAKYEQWRVSMGALGVAVCMLTGDTTTDLRLLSQHQVIVCSPEQWEVLSRRWRTRVLVRTLSLCVCSDLHLLNGPEGPALEAVVSRMRYINTQLEDGEPKCRLVGLSQCVANGKDIGEWLGAKKNSIFCFHNNARPIPLELKITAFDHRYGVASSEGCDVVLCSG
jgi:pre-mRNA-splicing helicase BRR2